MKQHRYKIQLDWTGHDGSGTETYKRYRRDHTISCEGKPPIPGSSDPNFRGDASRYNPEELLLAALSSCHMLWYLHLCAVNHITVVNYRDHALGVLGENEDGSGSFVGVQLNPIVTILPGNDRAKASTLHEQAHRYCFIAKSVNFPVKVVPEVIERSN